MTDETANRTLWFDDARKRYFLLPEDLEPAPGELELRTSLGRRMHATEGDVVRFEVNKEDGVQWSRQQLQRLLGRGGEANREEAGGAPLPLFSALSGESADDLRSDPEALKRGLREVGAKLGAVLKDAASVSAKQRERAKARLEELRAVVAEAEAAKGGGGAADAAAKREGAEKALRSFADLVGSLGRAAERAGAKFAAAADELEARREAAQGDGEEEEG